MRIVRLIARLLLLALLLCSIRVNRASAERVQLEVDPVLSRLTLIGSYLDIPLQPQDADATSGTVTLTGYIELETDSLAFPSGLEFNDSLFTLDTQGSWLPEPHGGFLPGEPGAPAAANFALWVDAGKLGAGWGAIRDLSFSFVPDTFDVTDNQFVAPAQLQLESGTFDYNVNTVVAHFLAQSSLTGVEQNHPQKLATWALTTEGLTLVVPVLDSTVT